MKGEFDRGIRWPISANVKIYVKCFGDVRIKIENARRVLEEYTPVKCGSADFKIHPIPNSYQLKQFSVQLL